MFVLIFGGILIFSLVYVIYLAISIYKKPEQIDIIEEKINELNSLKDVDKALDIEENIIDARNEINKKRKKLDKKKVS